MPNVASGASLVCRVGNSSRPESPISSDSVSQANSLHRSEGSSRRQGQGSFRVFGTPKKVCIYSINVAFDN